MEAHRRRSTGGAPAFVRLGQRLRRPAVRGRVHRASRPTTSVAAGRLDHGAQPVAAPASALSASYYCVGALTLLPFVNDARLLIVNTGTTPLDGVVTYDPSAGAETSVAVHV